MMELKTLAEKKMTPSKDLQSSACLQGERVSFTGTLASMTHREAHRLVEQHQGIPMPHVSQQITMLVIGEEGWPLEADGQPSQKLQQVTTWNEQGRDIQLLNESQWLHLLNLEQSSQEIQRLYTPAMLSKLLEIPVSKIRRWERMGLIRAEKKIFRLPYFDFQEVNNARKISELLAEGIPPEKIAHSLQKLLNLVSGIERPLAQLEILSCDSHLLYRDQAGWVEPLSGQRHFDFQSEQPALETFSFSEQVRLDQQQQVKPELPQNSTECFLQGCQLLEENELDSAIEAFRWCLMQDSQQPEYHFYLAEALYRLENHAGSLERYYAAVELDHNYIEAWTQIGCLHLEQNLLQSALESFQIALTIHEDYPDAQWYLAQVLDQLNRSEEAIPHWQKYLEFDQKGPWAEHAQQRLQQLATNHPPEL